MPLTNDQLDPRELILESYRIEGINASQCRSIFLDWAIGIPIGEDTTNAVQRLLAIYEPDNMDHPMTVVLRDALDPAAKPSRRGGAKARR